MDFPLPFPWVCGLNHTILPLCSLMFCIVYLQILLSSELLCLRSPMSLFAAFKPCPSWLFGLHLYRYLSFVQKMNHHPWTWHEPLDLSLPLTCWLQEKVVWRCFRASLVARTVKHLPAMRETWVWSLGWEDSLEKEMATYSSTLAWKIPWMERRLVGYSPWNRKELDTTEPGFKQSY